MKQTILAAFVLALLAPAAAAGPIERACNSSGRPQANAGLCACIQQAADMTLSRSEQTRAAKFFRDPHQAQVVRQSSQRGDSVFWERYRAFGTTAETYCTGF
jgi:hypothetical protein